jgi:hypothetical protein
LVAFCRVGIEWQVGCDEAVWWHGRAGCCPIGGM